MSNVVAIVEIIAYLHEDCGNVTDIALHTGLWQGTVIKYLRLLHKRKLIRIAEWHRYGKCLVWVPKYEWNTDNTRDAIKPANKTKAEVMKDYRAKKKSNIILTSTMA